jgi:dihydroceramide fatty acyl 2-hydroxylase
MFDRLLAECTIAVTGTSATRRIWQYNFDFVVFPLLAIWLVATECRSPSWAFLALLGILLFTFVEYWVHRIALHEMFYHGQHERHHTHPTEFAVFPIWYTPAIFAGFVVALPSPVFAGFVVGYCWFLVWHDVLHHADLGRLNLIRRYAVWHLAHHRLDDCNFGITVPIWDWLFGTYRRAH